MSKELPQKPRPSLPDHLPSYGRRRGRRLRPGRQELMESLLPGLAIAIPDEGMLEPQRIFPGKKEYWLEVGFGSGEHLIHQAANNPDIGIIGCEPYINGVAKLLGKIREQGLQNNIRIHHDDAREVTQKLPDACLSRVFILYPDPWPKARHHKRRLVSKPFLSELARLMKKGAELRLATDHGDYLTWMLEHTLSHPAFHWTAKSCEDWLEPWKDWIPTRYEQKRLAGRPTYLTFVRI